MHTFVFVYTHAYICVFVHVCVQRLRDQRMVFIYLSMYFRLCSIFVARRAFSSQGKSEGLLSSCSGVGFSLQWLPLLPSTGSRAHGIQQLWFLDSRAQAKQLWPIVLVALRHMGSFQIRDLARVSCITRRIVYH